MHKIKEEYILKKQIKKWLSLFFICIFLISMYPISASAYTESWNVYQYQGAPTSDCKFTHSTTFLAGNTYTKMSCTSAQLPVGYIYMGSSTGCSSIFYGTGSVTVNDVQRGVQVYAYVNLVTTSPNTHTASGTIIG